ERADHVFLARSLLHRHEAGGSELGAAAAGAAGQRETGQRGRGGETGEQGRTHAIRRSNSCGRVRFVAGPMERVRLVGRKGGHRVSLGPTNGTKSRVSGPVSRCGTSAARTVNRPVWTGNAGPRRKRPFLHGPCMFYSVQCGTRRPSHPQAPCRTPLLARATGDCRKQGGPGPK